ncbi:hypothetical protein [Arenibacter troitsensis]|uniref:Uncharacterized protein n=1 Tax=Arenibacter troitsensis TaxID=188872 RepID=A0A1X7L8U0_9FLAO|nr:hypothetical protein [Arenibacter troitsensis]SMG49702.1 hypothetical protein SAMN03080602_03861 [Arenibacter troitsensis]
MKHINISIKNEFGKQTSYKANNKIIKGLYATTDKLKVQENCVNLKIIVSRPNLKLVLFNNTKITVFGEICILTILGLGNKQSQFLIQKDLDLNNLKWLASKKLNGHYHDAIKRAYQTMMVLNLNNRFSKI